MILRRALLPRYRGAIARSLQITTKYRNPQQRRYQHTTYFQDPATSPTLQQKPKRHILRNTILVLVSFAAGYAWCASSTIALLRDAGISLQEVIDSREAQQEDDQLLDTPLGKLPIAPPDLAQFLNAWAYYPLAIEMGQGISVNIGSLVHSHVLASNVPCEDQFMCGSSLSTDGHPGYDILAIFDGHAGARTSFALAKALPFEVVEALHKVSLGSTSMECGNQEAIRAMQNAFLQVDDDLLQTAVLSSLDRTISRAVRTGGVFAADHGSCALVAVHDIKTQVLRVANTGDSRAVLGRWDSDTQRYVAIPLSEDHTGFNQKEVQRIQSEHPDEKDLIDPKTGRLFGLAVTRAFGDSRWKLPAEEQQRLHEQMSAYPPRPDGVVKTPPYLTACPDVMEVKIHTGAHPDFLIMASDGLWDHLSSEQAVELTEMWLNKYTPKSLVIKQRNAEDGAEAPDSEFENLSPSENRGEEDIFYDKDEKCLKWKNSTKHFTVRDECCATHLVRNALGGNRDGLVGAVLAVPPPRSRLVRDDITAAVAFFGADTEGIDTKRQR